MEIEENKKKKPKIREAILWCMRDKENPKASKKDIRDYYSKKGFELEESFFEHLLRANGKDYYEENDFIGFREFSPTLENEYMKISRKKEAEISISENEVEKSENKFKIQIVAKKENKKSLQDKNEKDIENEGRKNIFEKTPKINKNQISKIEKFNHFTDFNEAIKALAEKAEKENWGNNNKVLKSYIRKYYDIITDKEGHIITSEDGNYLCFNTGLLDVYTKDIYAIFKNSKLVLKDDSKRPRAKEWNFEGWFIETNPMMRYFDDFPPYYNLLKMKEDVIFDHTLDIIVNSEHILKNESRFPEFGSFNEDTLNKFFGGVARDIPKLVSRNPRIAIPQYYDNELGFLCQ